MTAIVPGSKSLDYITAVQSHHEPTKVQIAKQFDFQKREQTAGETYTDYNGALRKLALYYDFGAKLRDQIICGLRNKSLQRILLINQKNVGNWRMHFLGVQRLINLLTLI